MAISVDELILRYPTLFHMAAQGSWPSIQKHGLLCTSKLLDLFEVDPASRLLIEAHHRPESVPIAHPHYGVAEVRDQKPMSERGLRRALRDDLTPVDWYRILNDRVFFWPTRERLLRLLKARAYRAKVHTILEIDTAELLRRHHPLVMLSPINSGCTVPMPHPRGRDTFRTLADYPFEERRRRGLDPLAELCVIGGVPDIADFTVRVVDMRGEVEIAHVWP